MGSLLESILESILDHFGIHLDPLGSLGGSKWTSKGSWKVFWTLPKPRPRKTIEKVIFRDPQGSTDLKRDLWASVRVLDTSGPKSRVPACTGAHFRIF